MRGSTVDEPTASSATQDRGFSARQPNAVDNAFLVLEHVVQAGDAVTAAALVDSVPLSRATVYRILKHLLAHGYLTRSPDTAGLRLGPRVMGLVDAVTTTSPSPGSDHPAAHG